MKNESNKLIEPVDEFSKDMIELKHQLKSIPEDIKKLGRQAIFPIISLIVLVLFVLYTIL